MLRLLLVKFVGLLRGSSCFVDQHCLYFGRNILKNKNEK